MGWTDREPYFSQIQDRKDELEEQGENPASAFNIAYEECIDRMVSWADDERKSLKGE